MRPGHPALYDYEYKRNGTANLFLYFDPHRCWRYVEVTDHRASVDFAHQMRNLVGIHYPEAELICVVLDNLSTPNSRPLRDLSAPEAHCVLRLLEFHYTPKHAGWLNMVEIEISIMTEQCLHRRILRQGHLIDELAAWEQCRNTECGTIQWMFTVEEGPRKNGPQLSINFPVKRYEPDRLTGNAL